MILKHGDLAAMFSKGSAGAGFTFLDYDDTERVMRLDELHDEARGLGGELLSAGLRPGDRVALMVADNHDFVVSFMAVALAGGICCPLPPPSGLSGEDALVRTRAVLGYLRPRLIVAPPATVVGEPSVDPRTRSSKLAPVAAPDPASVAVIQCTSGATGLPKGVMLSHRGVLTNAHQIGEALKFSRDDVGVTWLPMHHDMGLIGCFLSAVYWEVPLVMMAPGKFLRRPASWLRAISKHRGTISPAPNFAYAYAAERIREDEVAELDLSTWRMAICGSEAVSPTSIEKFLGRFAHYGLRREVVVPCYGLAECALIVTAAKVGDFLKLNRIAGASDGLVSCGEPVSGTQVRILDDQGRELAEGNVGRIAVSSPSQMLGYFDLPEASRATPPVEWLDTGDLGYLHEGELYVSGREKDCLIFRGQCFAPTVFEWAAEQVEGIRPGGVAAVGIPDARQGTEALHLVCETRVKGDAEREQLRARLTAWVAATTGVAPSSIHLVRPGALPRTTSGKVRRNELRMSMQENQSNGASNDQRATQAAIREVPATELPR